MADLRDRAHDLFEEAVLQDASVRRAFVRTVCAGDATLQGRVDALLDAAEGVLVIDRPVEEAIANLLPAGHDPDAMIGKEVGAFLLESLLGRGGMGEVYAATDRELGRRVAIKILPAEVAADRERVARFRREAQVLAALNHPNIGAIYGIEPFHADQGETFALVLELVPGRTLADVIQAGPLPMDEALRIARQIADALDAAHQQGIVHRDLKPANIKVREDGTVKVLDFGLARPAALPRDGTAGMVVPSFSPTLSTPAMTGVGVILGTAAYMSPEQAKGRPVDKRSDIWAFGAVLYEMVTGTRAFAGEDILDTLATIVKSEPDWTVIPPRLQLLLRRCLQKDPQRRLRDIGDALALVDDGALAAAAPIASRRSRWTVGVGGAVLAMLVIVGSWSVSRRPSRAPSRTAHVTLPLPQGWRIDASRTESFSSASFAAVSPDGRYIALRGRSEDDRAPAIWLHDLETGQARALTGTTNVSTLFWSPDSRVVAFVADGGLKRVGLDGSPPVTISEAPGAIQGGTWGRGGIIVLSSASANPPIAALMQVGAGGGTLTPAVPIAPGEERRIRSHPWFLPDGRHLLYTEYSVEDRDSDALAPLYLQALGSPMRVRLMDVAGRNAQYAGGHLLFVRDGTLMAQAFDLARHTLTAEARPLAASVQRTGPPQVHLFSASDDILIYRVGNAPANMAQLAWLSRQGRVLSEIGTEASYREIRLAPDGRRAYTSMMGGRPWIVDLARGVRSPWSTAAGAFVGTAWSPDSRHLAFGITSSDLFAALHVKRADGSGPEQLLLKGADGTARVPADWAPDGRHLLFLVGRGPVSNNDIWVLPLAGDRRPYAFAASPANEVRAKFSPNGRWVAFVSNESGQLEVYVAPFAATSEDASSDPSALVKVPVSTAGGTAVRWRGDSRELFYLEAGTGRVMAASVDGSAGRFDVRDVRHLFSIPPPDPSNANPFDVSADGERFLVALPRGGDDPPKVMLNWAHTGALSAR